MPAEGLLSQAKRLVVGEPIPSHLAHHERFSRFTGLAVLSSDALSSVAYATEEILRVLVLVSIGALSFATPIAFIIAAILAIVVFSYRQTIHAYPSGGGAYIVAKDNLGEMPALIAAASLLIDYVLTVAVSIAAGVAALTSAFPQWHVNRVEMTLGFVLVLMLGNLRGIRESGRIFAIPTYMFVISLLGVIAVGAWRAMSGSIHPIAATQPIQPVGDTLTLFLLLTAFSNGCTAMTGVEAVSNGVPAFKPPESKNAAATMVMMAVLSITMFVGISLLAHAYHVIPSEQETVVSQIARGVFGGRGWPYYAVQGATMLILVLAANTAYADFPRLASILARDKYVPRQLMNQGDRLAFSNGIIGLSAFAAILLVAYRGDTHSLIPLYMIGVFVSFTLSQAGMVVHWRRLKGPGWKTSAFINGLGGLVTGIVLIVVALTKAREGAWVIMLLIPLHVFLFRATRRHYDEVARQLSLDGWTNGTRHRNTVLVPMSGVHRAVVQALEYAKTLSPDVRGVYVNIDPAATNQMCAQWKKWGNGVPLVVLESPYRSLMEPLLEYIEQVDAAQPDDFVTIVLPEFVPARWWHHVFHNQRALLIKGALLFRPNVVVTSVPFHLNR
ncbi:MAG TPA: APC family permease [Vicinamibacterales bacterium]|nr:APC family permease [Vicinamibacterales bacterium]